jgi:hypothetical protein
MLHRRALDLIVVSDFTSRSLSLSQSDEPETCHPPRWPIDGCPRTQLTAPVATLRRAGVAINSSTWTEAAGLSIGDSLYAALRAPVRALNGDGEKTFAPRAWA